MKWRDEFIMISLVFFSLSPFVWVLFYLFLCWYLWCRWWFRLYIWYQCYCSCIFSTFFFYIFFQFILRYSFAIKSAVVWLVIPWVAYTWIEWNIFSESHRHMNDKREEKSGNEIQKNKREKCAREERNYKSVFICGIARWLV